MEARNCQKCGGEGHLVCRPAVLPAVGERYTVDCEDNCGNATKGEHLTSDAAIGAWNDEQEALRLEIYGDGGRTPSDFA